MTTDLRARARAGDPTAFGELFDRYAKTVYNHAFRLTADWSSAEDVMSTTFLQAWRLRGRIDADHTDDVGRRLDDDRRLGHVLTALASLRRPEREVVTLCLWEGVDYATAAAALGVPVGTVRSRLSRARRKLRDLLGVPPQLGTGQAEPALLPGQVRGDRNPAARTVTEGT